MSNEPGGTNKIERERDRHPLQDFLGDANQDVQRMRGLEAALATGDEAAWARLDNIAHNLAARSQLLKLGLLNACARELQQLVDEYRKGTPLDTFFLQCVASAIETLALEVDSLRRS